jgi:FMN phosphatase YigB (HAD superfamily)
MTDLQAILFDLDDTLLNNHVDGFLKAYFALLTDHARELLPPEQFLPELLHATQAAIASQDPTLTNRDVFWSVFARRTGLERVAAEPFFNRFYRDHFGQLREVTSPRPAAKKLMALARDRGWRVVIATNPLFPLTAIEQRLAWAGVPVDVHRYDLITSYDNMHFAKPHQAYYREILDCLSVPPSRALMAGDDWDNDIAPAAAVGLHTFWIAEKDAPPPDPAVPLDGQGTLDVLYDWLAG